MEARGVVDGVVEWASAARPLPGERTSGDVAVVAPRKDGALVAVVDGLGHGPDAAAVAAEAGAVLRADPDAALAELFRRCDVALAGRRGVVMTLVVVDARGRVTWAGVGDVEATIVPAARGARRRGLSLRGGTVGDGAPAPHPRTTTESLATGDLLVVGTDGMAAGFADHVVPAADVATAAAVLLQRCARKDDDALVVVARFIGTESGR